MVLFVLGRLVLIFLVFGIAVLPMSYLASFLFTIPSTGCVRLILLNILTGLAAFVTVEMLGAPTIDLSDKARFIEWGFLFVPHFTFSSAIRSTHMIYATVSKCKEVCSNFNSSVNYDVCIKMICKSKNLCCGKDNCTRRGWAALFDWNMPLYQAVVMIRF